MVLARGGSMCARLRLLIFLEFIFCPSQWLSRKPALTSWSFFLLQQGTRRTNAKRVFFIVFSGEPPSSHPLLPPNPLYLDVETHSTGVIPSSPSNPLCPTHSREPPNSLFHPSHSATSYITPSRSFDLAHRSLSHLVWIYWLRSSPA